MGRGGQRPPSLKELQSPLVADVAKAGLAPPAPAARWTVDPKYAIYAFTYLLSRATGAGAHLVPALAKATLLRYLVNHAFVALSKWDAFAEPRRIHRKNPPASQLERELDCLLREQVYERERATRFLLEQDGDSDLESDSSDEEGENHAGLKKPDNVSKGVYQARKAALTEGSKDEATKQLERDLAEVEEGERVYKLDMEKVAVFKAHQLFKNLNGGIASPQSPCLSGSSIRSGA